MTTYRPGFSGPRNGKHLRHDAKRDTIFSDEENAFTDWIPVQRGSVVNILVHAANLRRVIRNGVAIGNEFDVIRLETEPKGRVTLKHKLGGEPNERAAILGSWGNTMVSYNQEIQMRGFVRLEFGCTTGQLLSEHKDELGSNLTPNGLFVSIEVV